MRAPSSIFKVLCLLPGIALAGLPGVALGQDTGIADGFGFYGQINQGYLRYADEVESISYGRVDTAVDDQVNNLGVTYGGMLNSGIRYQARAEVGFAPKPSNEVSQRDRSNSSFEFDINSLRKLEVSFGTPGSGTFFFGQGDMSGRGPGPDYSGTEVIQSSNPADVAGGNFWRREIDGALTNRPLNASFDNFESGRRFRLRYDSREYGNLSFSASLGREVLDSSDDTTYVDVFGNYERSFGNGALDLAIRFGVNRVPDPDYAARFRISTIHTPSGVNFSGETGHTVDGPHFYYYKFGIVRDFFSFGATAVAVDFYNSGKFVVIESESVSRSLGIVQYVDRANLEIYATFRRYGAYNNVGLPLEEFSGSSAFLTGFRLQF